MRVGLREQTEELLVAGLALAEHHELEAVMVQEVWQDLDGQVEALLPDQAKDQAKGRHLGAVGQMPRRA